jgi:hypothetical protein
MKISIVKGVGNVEVTDSKPKKCIPQVAHASGMARRLLCGGQWWLIVWNRTNSSSSEVEIMFYRHLVFKICDVEELFLFFRVDYTSKQ